MNPFSRRQFLQRTALGTAGIAWAAGPGWGPRVLGANDRIVLAVMGANGRGSDLAAGFLKLGGVEIGVVCDVDDRALAKGVQTVVKGGGREPRGVRDVRRVLDDRSVDALVVATPDHWHGPATILACSAGKHVYVEKPACHNPQEGEWMIAAARKHRRVVQVGMQRRSMPQIIEAIERVRAGAVGTVRFSRGWYTNTRGSIGRGRPVPVPAGLDWTLWQGPAPERPFRDNIVHYHWHWFWHWGTGELGNNGIHALDLCRWGLGVDFPQRVVSGGGRYHFPDDQETPDTQVVTFEFGDRAITWEGRSCQRHGLEGSGFGASFHGDQGTLVTDGTGYRIYDAADKEIQKVPGTGGDAPHLRDFLDAIRSGRQPRADIDEGHRSTLLCHLGNIAWRTSGAVTCDPRNGRLAGDRAARKLWEREYRKGWVPRP
ncbi:MAG TPA: Gfo/Idh/MocA family oxidoreductase [Verrucomicrobiota bacterium]|nr:Gfo/Idh/MocA family oxidoreductase [Verrucomicrobiota bacterium]HNU52195.1 Gfo/Idh/MocA family oxidoreductase [Verrucomicrobiota bacterium]